MHPDTESMIRQRDGELPADRRKAVKRHLRACVSCRTEYERLCQAVAPQAARALPAASPGTPDILNAVLERINEWDKNSARSGEASSAVKQTFAAELERYLGARAAGRILRSVSDDGDNLLSTVEPLLALFLGREAASQFVTRVLDTAL